MESEELPNYLPPATVEWAIEHADLLDLVAADVLAHGEWPEIAAMTKRLAAAGMPTAVRDIFWQMPKPFGWIDSSSEQIRLSLFGLRFARPARPLLEGYVGVLRLAVERFPEEGEASRIRRADLDGLVEPNLIDVLAMILRNDSPFLGGFGGDDDEWFAPVDDRVVHYWDARSVDDYLRIRAEELARNLQFGYPYRVQPDAEEPVVEVGGGDVRDDYPTDDASEQLGDELGVVEGEHEWRIGEQLDRGGMGVVFEAASGDRLGVVKLVPKDPGAERELLFVNPDGVKNLVPIWDQGEWNGYWFIVMPRADCSLAAYLDEHGAFSTSDAIDVLLDVADALVGLDGQIVHRDLKPGNVLLLDGHWCLADFGIARYAEATTATETHKWAMTPPYAAPEQWRHERATSATDIYAVGVIAYELLTGARPFQGPGQDDFREQHLYEQPPAISGAPSTLVALVSDCLSKSAGARPSAQTLRDRLERAARPVASRGLASLQNANRIEAERKSKAAIEGSRQMTADEQRAALLTDAKRSYGDISDALYQAIVGEASSAQAKRDPDVGSWQISLGRAQIQMTQMKRPDAWSPTGLFDLVAVGTVAVSFSRDPSGYQGRAHSLWFADALVEGSYQWFETGFTLMALMHEIPAYEPFPLDGGEDAVHALQPITHTHRVAYPFTPLAVGDLEDFIDRWAEWFGAASQGQLQRISGGGANPEGSWRRG
jgi:serine/threonine-protein kinase